MKKTITFLGIIIASNLLGQISSAKKDSIDAMIQIEAMREIAILSSKTITGAFVSSWFSPNEEHPSVDFKGEDGKDLHFYIADGLRNQNVFCNYELLEEEKTVKSNVGKKYKIKYTPGNNGQGRLGEIVDFEEVSSINQKPKISTQVTHESISNAYKNDSTQFRKFQTQKELNGRLNVFKMYSTPPGKQIKNVKEIELGMPCVWVLKDSSNLVSLIITIEGSSGDEWAAPITIYSFDKNGKLNLIRKEENRNFELFNVSQNWVSDKDSQPCDYYMLNNNFQTKKSYCDVSEVSSYVNKTSSDILKSFGIR